MLPTLNVTGDLLLQIPLFSILNVKSNRTLIPNSNDSLTESLNLNRGDLVNFTSPLNPSVLACKRILGLPGDKILVDSNHLDRRPYHSLIESSQDTTHKDYRCKTLLTIPAGHLWLQGDNYAVSIDSRTYGPVPISLVSGKIVARVWPNFTWLSEPFEYNNISTQ